MAWAAVSSGCGSVTSRLPTVTVTSPYPVASAALMTVSSSRSGATKSASLCEAALPGVAPHAMSTTSSPRPASTALADAPASSISPPK